MRLQVVVNMALNKNIGVQRYESERERERERERASEQASKQASEQGERARR